MSDLQKARANDFRQMLEEAGQRLYKRLMRHRDRYIKAWVAATGVYPTEALLVEWRSGCDETVVQLQRLEDKDETLRVYEQVLLQAGLLPRARHLEGTEGNQMKVEAQTQTKTETIGVTIQLTTSEAQELERVLGCIGYLPAPLVSLIWALHKAGIEKIEPRGRSMDFALKG